jgi:hypothetical protein
MRRRRFWSVIHGILLSLAVSLIIAAWPGSSTFTVSPETTYITEPLDKDGYPDYVTALNQRISKGITPEQNANVLIWQALGPRPEGGDLPDEYFQWLRIERPPEDGDYFVWWDRYRKQHKRSKEATERDGDSELPADLPLTPWNAKDMPEIADWLEQNKKPIAQMIDATHRAEYFNPLVPFRTDDWCPGLLNALLPSVQKCREIAAALVCRAMLKIAEGKTDEAWQDLLACHRLARQLTRGATLVERLVGYALEGVASKGDVEFIQHSKLTSKRLSACSEDLRRLPPIPALADCIDLGERFMLLDMIMMTSHYGPDVMADLAKSPTKPPAGNRFTSGLFTRSINWDQALLTANRWIDRYVEAARIHDRSVRSQEISKINQDIGKLKARVGGAGWFQQAFASADSRGELTGEIMVGLMLPSYWKIQSSADRIEQVQANLQLAFALAAYHSDSGSYPAKLDALAPKYLEKIPNDLFSGKPLIYRLEGDGYLLYSVGANGIDDGGASYDDQPPGDDIRIRKPVPAPQNGK